MFLLRLNYFFIGKLAIWKKEPVDIYAKQSLIQILSELLFFLKGTCDAPFDTRFQLRTVVTTNWEVKRVSSEALKKKLKTDSRAT